MITRLLRFLFILAFGFDLLLAGCNGGGGGGGEPPVGPNLNGDWAGSYYGVRTGDPGRRAVTANIRHRGTTVIINTSLTGAGATLTGTIDPDGEMVLTDPYDGETWTTHVRPASPTRVQVADYLYDDELGAESPLRVIDLSRPASP